jgi:mannose-6-phosphate isomerase-like protein (cupin superfamily)
VTTLPSRRYGPITNTTEGLGITRHLVGGEGACRWKMLMYGMHLGLPWNTVEYVVIPPGASCGEHIHAHTEEIYYILKGSATMHFNGDSLQVTAGDLITTPIGVRHGIANHTAQDMVLFVVEVFPGSGTGHEPTRISLPQRLRETVAFRGADSPIRVVTINVAEWLTGAWRAFTLAEIPPSGTLGPYRCKGGVEVLFVVQGQADVAFGQESLSGTAGLCVAVPVGMPRSISNTSAEMPLALICTEVRPV